MNLNLQYYIQLIIIKFFIRKLIEYKFKNI